MAMLDASVSRSPPTASSRSRWIRARPRPPRLPMLGRAWLQPDVGRRAGLRPDGPAGGESPAELRDDAATVDAAREAGFKSVNLDLIYGLPKQTRRDLRAHPRPGAAAVTRTHRALPLRAPAGAIQAAASHRRGRRCRAPRRKIDDPARCDQAPRRCRLSATSAWTTSRGPSDDLARAQRQGRLHRNFQGYRRVPIATWSASACRRSASIGPTYCAERAHARGVLRPAAPRPAAYRRAASRWTATTCCGAR